MSIESMKKQIAAIANEYSLCRVTLFGSRASGTNRIDSDIDLIVEFSKPISLITLSSLQLCLEDLFHLDVDVVHGPLRENDMIEVGKVIELYAA